VACMNLDPPGARPHLEESVRLAEESGNRLVANGSLAYIGWALSYEGDLPHARAVLERAVQGAIETSTVSLQRWHLVFWQSYWSSWTTVRRH
jgi:hypothetical protein